MRAHRSTAAALETQAGRRRAEIERGDDADVEATIRGWMRAAWPRLALHQRALIAVEALLLVDDPRASAALEALRVAIRGRGGER